jgi:hypothetical protein
LIIRCPVCPDMVFLAEAEWEESVGVVTPGQPTRVGLVCNVCHNEFLLQMTLSQVAKEE